MLTVGRDRVLDERTGKGRSATYKDVQYDYDGWADPSKFLPADFDMMHLKLKSGKTLPGWHSMTEWDGLRLEPNDEVVRWKRKEPEKIKLNSENEG